MDDIVSELGPLEPPLSEEVLYNHVDHAIPQDQSEFCKASNFASALNYVNLQLTAQGYPVPLVFNTNDQDACKVVNCLEAILDDKKELVLQVNQMKDSEYELKREQERLQSKLDKTNQELEKQKRENAQLRAKNESAGKAVKAEVEKNRLLREDLSKAKNNMMYMRIQYAHENRKHEQEQTKMRERNYKLMGERYKATVASMTVNEMLPGMFDDEHLEVSEEKAMYTDLLTKSSDREKEARKEGERIRDILLEIYGAGADLLKRQVDRYQNAFPKEANQGDLPLFRLPLEIGGAEATNRVHDLLARLRQEWDRQIANRKAYSEEDMVEKDRAIERLTKSNTELIDAIEQCKIEYEEKANVYLRYAEGGFFDTVDPRAIAELSDSESSVMDGDAPKSTSKLKKLQRDAKAERQRITAAAIELGDERTKLAAERWAFEEMKRQLEMSAILADESPPSSPDVGSRRRSTYQDQQETTQERSQKRPRPWLGQAPQS